MVVGGSEEVVEDLEDDGDAAPRMTDAALTAWRKGARKSPREDAWRVIHKTFYDCSWFLRHLCMG